MQKELDGQISQEVSDTLVVDETENFPCGNMSSSNSSGDPTTSHKIL